MTKFKVPVDLIMSKMAEASEQAQEKARKGSEVLLEELETLLLMADVGVAGAAGPDDVLDAAVVAWSATRMPMAANEPMISGDSVPPGSSCTTSFSRS